MVKTKHIHIFKSGVRCAIFHTTKDTNENQLASLAIPADNDNVRLLKEGTEFYVPIFTVATNSEVYQNVVDVLVACQNEHGKEADIYLYILDGCGLCGVVGSHEPLEFIEFE